MLSHKMCYIKSLDQLKILLEVFNESYFLILRVCANYLIYYRIWMYMCIYVLNQYI